MRYVTARLECRPETLRPGSIRPWSTTLLQPTSSQQTLFIVRSRLHICTTAFFRTILLFNRSLFGDTSCHSIGYRCATPLPRQLLISIHWRHSLPSRMTGCGRSSVQLWRLSSAKPGWGAIVWSSSCH